MRMRKKPYNPREDTFHLLDTVKEFVEDGDKILEVGVGSSYILSRIGDDFEVTTIGTDIGKQETKTCKLEGHHSIRCSTSEAIDNDSLDMIYFNLPYLRKSDEISDRALDYNPNLLSEFIINSERCLKTGGHSIFLISDSTPCNVTSIIESSSLEMYDKKVKCLFFEELDAYIMKKL